MCIRKISWSEFFGFQKDYASGKYCHLTIGKAFCEVFGIKDRALENTGSRSLVQKIVQNYYISKE